MTLGFHKLTIGQKLMELPALTLQTFLHLHDVLLQKNIFFSHVLQTINSGGTEPSIGTEVSFAQNILSETVDLMGNFELEINYNRMGGYRDHGSFPSVGNS